MPYKLVNVDQHEILPIQKLLELMREPRRPGSTHILAITIGDGSVSFSVAAPRGRVVIANPSIDITIETN